MRKLATLAKVQISKRHPSLSFKYTRHMLPPGLCAHFPSAMLCPCVYSTCLTSSLVTCLHIKVTFSVSTSVSLWSTRSSVPKLYVFLSCFIFSHSIQHCLVHYTFCLFLLFIISTTSMQALWGQSLFYWALFVCLFVLLLYHQQQKKSHVQDLLVIYSKMDTKTFQGSTWLSLTM